MRQQTVVLIGLGVGLFFTVIAQYIFPSTLFLSGSSLSFYIDPEAGIVAYLTVPLMIGAAVGLVERQEAGENGLISGAATGVVNLVIAGSRYSEIVVLQAQTDLLFFAVVLIPLWAFLAGFAAKATAWSLENPSIRLDAKVPYK